MDAFHTEIETGMGRLVSDRHIIEALGALTALDADELLAVIENLSGCRVNEDGPPNRLVPETLCEEVIGLLELLERSLRRLDRNNNGS